MKPYYEDLHNTLYNEDFRKNDLPDESVQCVVTSPPYWGLRKYSGEQDLIWGDKDCEHQWGDIIPNPMVKSGKHGPASILTKTADEQHAVRKESNQGRFCSLCGAWKGAYGLEPTPDCGRPFAKLRGDLTDKEVEYVMGELKRCGLL